MKKPDKNVHYVYIVHCRDDTLYTGYTNDIGRRLQAHNSGKGAKYTKTRRPVRLVFWKAFADKSSAMSAEWKIKHLTRSQKEKLMETCLLIPALRRKIEEPGR